MNKQEVAKFLTLTALIDNRAVTAEAALMWGELLGATPYNDAVAAMQAHYRESSDWLMPVHVLTRIRQAHRLELPETMSPEAPESCEPTRPHRWLADGTCLLCTTRREVRDV